MDGRRRASRRRRILRRRLLSNVNPKRARARREERVAPPPRASSRSTQHPRDHTASSFDFVARAFPLSQLPAPTPRAAPDARPRRRSRAVVFVFDEPGNHARSNPSSIAGMSKRGVEPVRVRDLTRRLVRVAIAPRRSRRARRRRLVRMDESRAPRGRVGRGRVLLRVPRVREVRAPRRDESGPRPGPGFRRVRVDGIPHSPRPRPGQGPRPGPGPRPAPPPPARRFSPPKSLARV